MRICSLTRISRNEMKNIFDSSQLKRRQNVVFAKFMDDLDSFEEDEASDFDTDLFKTDSKRRLRGQI